MIAGLRRSFYRGGNYNNSAEAGVFCRSIWLGNHLYECWLIRRTSLRDNAELSHLRV